MSLRNGLVRVFYGGGRKNLWGRFVDLLVKYILQKEQADKAYDAGDNGRDHPTEPYTTQHPPSDATAALQDRDAHNGADDGLRTGYGNQRNGRQIV